MNATTHDAPLGALLILCAGLTACAASPPSSGEADESPLRAPTATIPQTPLEGSELVIVNHKNIEQNYATYYKYLCKYDQNLKVDNKNTVKFTISFLTAYDFERKSIDDHCSMTCTDGCIDNNLLGNFEQSNIYLRFNKHSSKWYKVEINEKTYGRTNIIFNDTDSNIIFKIHASRQRLKIEATRYSCDGDWRTDEEVFRIFEEIKIVYEEPKTQTFFIHPTIRLPPEQFDRLNDDYWWLKRDYHTLYTRRGDVFAAFWWSCAGALRLWRP